MNLAKVAFLAFVASLFHLQEIRWCEAPDGAKVG